MAVWNRTVLSLGMTRFCSSSKVYEVVGVVLAVCDPFTTRFKGIMTPPERTR